MTSWVYKAFGAICWTPTAAVPLVLWRYPLPLAGHGRPDTNAPYVLMIAYALVMPVLGMLILKRERSRGTARSAWHSIPVWISAVPVMAWLTGALFAIRD